MPVISVIIPFYQKRERILHRALTSVLQQNLPADTGVDIIVVNDGSPSPLINEIEDLEIAIPFRLLTINQKNQGVAAARNTALDHMRQETDYVAFLDSDDMWGKEYLATALTAFNQGADFFFCDTQRVGDLHSGFSEKKFGDFLVDHAVPHGDFYEVDKTAFFAESLKSRAFRIPGIVYRKAVAPDIVFDTSLRTAGEDCLFLFQVISQCSRIFCIPKTLVVFGDGVNIYAGKYSWDDASSLVRNMGLILMFYAWRKKLPLSPDNQRLVQKRISAVHRLFAFLTMRYFIKQHRLWPKQLREMIHNDHTFWLWYPFTILYILVMYPLRLYSPLGEW